VREHGGVLLIGPPGTGKSHIAVALTVAAIQAGHTAPYRSAFDLTQDMAEATGTRKEVIAQLCKVDLLVLEDLGMKRLPPTAVEDLLEVFVRLYEKGAIILVPWKTGARCWEIPQPRGLSWTVSCITPRSSGCREGATACTTGESCAASRQRKP